MVNVNSFEACVYGPNTASSVGQYPGNDLMYVGNNKYYYDAYVCYGLYYPDKKDCYCSTSSASFTTTQTNVHGSDDTAVSPLAAMPSDCFVFDQFGDQTCSMAINSGHAFLLAYVIIDILSGFISLVILVIAIVAVSCPPDGGLLKQTADDEENEVPLQSLRMKQSADSAEGDDHHIDLFMSSSDDFTGGNQRVVPAAGSPAGSPLGSPSRPSSAATMTVNPSLALSHPLRSAYLNFDEAII